MFITNKTSIDVSSIIGNYSLLLYENEFRTVLSVIQIVKYYDWFYIFKTITNEK